MTGVINGEYFVLDVNTQEVLGDYHTFFQADNFARRRAGYKKTFVSVYGLYSVEHPSATVNEPLVYLGGWKHVLTYNDRGKVETRSTSFRQLKRLSASAGKVL